MGGLPGRADMFLAKSGASGWRTSILWIRYLWQVDVTEQCECAQGFPSYCRMPSQKVLKLSQTRLEYPELAIIQDEKQLECCILSFSSSLKISEVSSFRFLFDWGCVCHGERLPFIQIYSHWALHKNVYFVNTYTYIHVCIAISAVRCKSLVLHDFLGGLVWAISFCWGPKKQK